MQTIPKYQVRHADPDGEALNRFKKQRTALKQGRKTKETYHFTSKDQKIIKTAKLNEKQYQICITKLCQAGITDEELALFKSFNKQDKSGV